MQLSTDLYLRYAKPAPRYNTYPIPSHWTNTLSPTDWLNNCQQTLNGEDPKFSIYIHIPFCEKKCSHCACNTYITTDHSLEESYIQTIHQEFRLYCQKINPLSTSSLVHLYLGGGTPNFFSAQNLKRLLQPILSAVKIATEHEFTVEMDLRHVQGQHLQTLYDLGFRHLRLGIEDFTPIVQRIINRQQSQEQAGFVCDTARSLGYHTIHFDMIYGLPLQTPKSSAESMQIATQLKPDYLTYFSYAHVPGVRSLHRPFAVEELPSSLDKLAIYRMSYEVLTKSAGFQAIGMDYFAKPKTPLLGAKQNKTLQWQIMGYSCYKTDLLIGLGVSAISAAKGCYHQNENILHKYNKKIAGYTLPTLKSHKLSEDDTQRRAIIQGLITQGHAKLTPEIQQKLSGQLRYLEQSNLIQCKGILLEILPLGKFFLRNICAMMDSSFRP